MQHIVQMRQAAILTVADDDAMGTASNSKGVWYETLCIRGVEAR